MIYFATTALIIQLIGIFTSVSIIAVGQILFIIPLIYSIKESIKNKDTKIPASAYFLITFVLIAILSLVINAEYVPKLSRNFQKLKYPIIGLGSIFFFRYWIKNSTEKMKQWTANFFLVSMIVAAVWGISMYFIKDMSRVNGLTHTMRYGYGTAMILLPLLGIILQKEKFAPWLNTKLALSALILGFAGLVLTYTRGAMLGFLCGLPFALFFYKRKIGIAVTAVSLTLAMIMGGYYLFGKTNTSSRFLITKENKSDSMRRSVWDSAVIAIKERPLLGWGYTNFHSQMKRIKIEHNLPEQDFNDTHAHNVPLEIWAGTGIFGLLAFLGWFITWGLESKKTYAGRSLILPMGIVLMIASQFEVTLDTNSSTLIFMLYALSSAKAMK